MEQIYYTFAFNSTHAAMAAQKLLTPLGALIMPTLREISASCGMSLRMKPERTAEAREIMENSSIDPSLYQLFVIRSAPGSPPVIDIVQPGQELPV